MEPLSDTHTVRETLVTEKLIPHINDSTNHQASAPARRTTPEKPVLARPKEPPPPLPKTPPKGPATRKTPPTLPKHPPKGQGGLPSSSDSKLQSDKLDISAVKPIVKSRSFTDTDIKASEADSNSREIKNNTDLNEGNEDKSPQKTKWNFREHKSPKAPPGVIKPKPRRKTIDTVQTKSDHSQHSEEVNRNKTPALERGISIGNSTWFNASLDEADEKSSKKLSSDSAKHLSTESDDKTIVKPTVIQRATSVGKSTFFVEPDNLCDENDLADVQSNLIENVKEGIETDEEHKKLEESGVSAHPAPVRTPPPVPKKIIHKVSIPSTHTASSPEPGHSDINSATNSHKQSFSCDNKGGSGVNEETPSKAIKPDSAINEKAKSYQPSTKPRRSLTPADSLENQPKPVPRKPIPTVKPRPVPKKRSTKKRHSGSEEFILSQSVSGSVDNLPLQCNLDAVDKNLSTNERSGEEVSERITKTSADGEEKQYRVIDKSVLGASNQNTALEKAGNKTALDVRKISPERSLESDQALTVVELRKKFKESKSADTSNHAQVNVPNINKNDSQKVKVASDKKELNSSSNDHTPSSLKSSFEDLLADKSILEPSSLLNEIEEILSRSYKHSSLTRSGSSPEKRGISVYRDSLDVRTERSQSLDLGSDQKTSTPIRPPRPKKEAKAKRLRSQSQIVYDTCASDTESLPDLSITREEQFLSLKDDFSKTLGPARPHPPKPKRNKLLKVQRSHSDITKMKSFLDQKEMEGNKISPHKRQLSDFSPVLNNGDAKSPGQLKGIGPQGNSVSTDQSNMSRARRPTRKAPPPPIKIVTKTPSTDLNIVVPVDTRVKSKNLEKKSLKRHSLEDSSGSIYDSINDQEVPYSSDEDHDYHEIPEHLRQGKGNSDSRSKSGSPPKLPPRNYSSSNSFDSSSQSGFVCDISIVDGASSVEDLSVSSAMLKPDSGSRTNSPSLKRPQISKPLPSPLLHRKLEEIQSLDRSGLSGSNLSIPESLDGSVGSRTRPVSNASEMTVTSSESEGEDEATKVILVT